MERVGSSSELDARPGQAVYNKLTLALYDPFVLGLSNRLAWRCPSRHILDLYNQFVGLSHLEVGVGTGYFLDHCNPSVITHLTLFDLNPSCLEQTAHRLRRFEPRTQVGNVLEPLPSSMTGYDSVGLNYVLHCLPGTPEQKGVALDHVCAALNPGGVCFGSTIVTNESDVLLASTLKWIYNYRGIFGNKWDTPEAIRKELERRFERVETRQIGSVLLFSGRKPTS